MRPTAPRAGRSRCAPSRGSTGASRHRHFIAQLITGLLLVATIDWDLLRQAWLELSLGIYVLLTVLAMTVYAPSFRTQREIAEAIAEGNADESEYVQHEQEASHDRRLSANALACTPCDTGLAHAIPTSPPHRQPRGPHGVPAHARRDREGDVGDFRLEVTETKDRHASEIATQAVDEGVDLVVVFSGDGTINEVVNSLAGTETALGVLPGGATNILVRGLGSTEPVDAPAC